MVSCTLGSAVFTAFIAVLWLVSPASSAFNYDMKQKAVSQLILSKLGMTQPPDVTPEQIASVDKTVLREYRTLTGISSFTLGTEKQALSEQEYYADTVTIIDVTEWTGILISRTRIVDHSFFPACRECLWQENSQQVLPVGCH
jgi:hypothetical protein